ncbi:MAG: DUF6427 family protein [Bacteroidota bacterium]
MFTRIFKSDYIFQFIFFIVTALIIWIKAFISADISYAPLNAPLYDIIKWMLGNHLYLKISLSFALLILQALIFKRILSSNDLSPKNTLLPAFLYVVLMSSFGNFQNIQPLLFANLFIILGLQTIFNAYSKAESYEQIFNAALMISIASQFYFPVFIFMFFIWLVLLIFSILKWREWLISLLGFITPYLFLGCFYFLTDRLQNKLLDYRLFFKNINLQHPHLQVSHIIFLCILALFFIIALIVTSSRLSERSIFYRKKIIVLITFSILSILSFIFAKDFFIFQLGLLFIPFSFFFANFIVQIKKIILSEIIYLIVFGSWLYIYLGI